jgi:kynurenine formamidase
MQVTSETSDLPSNDALFNNPTLQDQVSLRWQLAGVSSPHANPVQVIAAKDISYIPNNNRLQTPNIYLVRTQDTSKLIGTPVTALPVAVSHNQFRKPNWQVHIHGGAWRDGQLTAKSIEAAVAHAFSAGDAPITAIASINYTVSPFPNVPPWMSTTPYDPFKNNHSDPAHEVVHPQHVSDVLHGLVLLRSYGLKDGTYILSGYSCGACLAFQAVLQAPSYYELDKSLEPPRPAAILGFNGLYDLPNLVYRLGPSHAHLKDDYDGFLGIAFETNRIKWPAASPVSLDVEADAKRIEVGRAPRLVMLDQSSDDQLVPMNQWDTFEGHLKKV